MAPNGAEWQELHSFPKDPFVITASSVGSMYPGIGFTSPAQMMRNYQNDNYEPKSFVATQHGHDNEPRAIESFLDNHPEFRVHQPGLLMDRERHWLGATTDGIAFRVGDPKLWNFEVKCPYSGTIPVNPQAIKPLYIIQTQIQMHVWGLKDTLFWVWTKTKAVLHHIPLNPKFIQLLLEDVEAFKIAIEKGQTETCCVKTPRFNEALEETKKATKFVEYIDFEEKNNSMDTEKYIKNKMHL